MGGMTLCTSIGNVTVFEDEWTLLLHMAAGTGILGCIPLEEVILARPVDIVTVDTHQLLFYDRVVGHK